MLAQYVSANQKDWDVWIPSVLFAYRTAVHDSTGYSPYKLLFGREPKQPVDFQFPLPSIKRTETTPNYFSALRRTLDSVQEQAAQNLRQAQSVQKSYHDRGVTADQFSIGNLVLVYNPVTHGSPKFQKHWEGPYLVVSKLAGGVTYMLRSVTDDKFLTVHRERLKPCHAESLQEQCVQIVGASLPEPDRQIPPNQPPPNNQPVPPQAQPVLPPIPVPQVPAPLAVHPAPAAVPAVPNPQPLVAPPAMPPAVPAAPPAVGRPKRNAKPPERLVDQYTPALAPKPRKNK